MAGRAGLLRSGHLRLLTVADFFFDGFLADFLVQRRINEARARIDQACRQVEDVLYRLGGTD